MNRKIDVVSPKPHTCMRLVVLDDSSASYMYEALAQEPD
jgi:hypothetical protein